jgi:tetratricopeptide (TPR) repeat protein
VFNSPLGAQSLKSLLKQGEEAMADKNYFSAAQVYNRVILIDSATMDFQYKYATASRLNADPEIAEHWYQKVFKKDNAKMYPETPFWLGMIYKNEAKYKDAKKMFLKFYSKNKSNKNADRKQMAVKAKLESEACDLALILMRNPLPYKVEHLDSLVNSKVSEYAPFEWDSTLYFSSLRFSNDRDRANNINFNKLYTAKQAGNGFLKAKELDTLFNKNGIHNANTCFNRDFTKIFITRCMQQNASTFQCEIWVSDWQNSKWSDFKKLPAQVNAPGSNNTQPNVGFLDSTEYLFFSSSRPGGSGGQDIWYCSIKPDGTYGTAINAGNKVNSVEDEITPFYVHQQKLLFFSSTWHKGLGGFDIFKSAWKDGSFGEPENAGYPINSPLNDIYYSVSSRKNMAYISSNRKGSYFAEKESCCNDIYRFSIPPLEVPPPPVDTSALLINQMKVLVPLTLFFHNDEPNPKTKAITTSKNYKTTYDEYKALQSKYNQEYPKGLEPEAAVLAANRVENFFEDSVDAGMHDLDRFAELLEKVLARNEKVKITMKGYCSPLASTDYNVNLAKRRISSLQNYFREYKNGLFVKYINNPVEAQGRIEFFEEDIGELEKSKVSDDVKDTRNSVYSPYAAAERKIQIIAVSYLK